MYLILIVFAIIIKLLVVLFFGDTYEKNGYKVKRKIIGRGRGKFEHRAIVETVLGHAIPTDYEVHHINFNRGDNSISNLCLIHRDQHYHNWHRWMQKEQYHIFNKENKSEYWEGEDDPKNFWPKSYFNENLIQGKQIGLQKS